MSRIIPSSLIENPLVRQVRSIMGWLVRSGRNGLVFLRYVWLRVIFNKRLVLLSDMANRLYLCDEWLGEGVFRDCEGRIWVSETGLSGDVKDDFAIPDSLLDCTWSMLSFRSFDVVRFTEVEAGAVFRLYDPNRYDYDADPIVEGFYPPEMVEQTYSSFESVYDDRDDLFWYKTHTFLEEWVDGRLFVDRMNGASYPIRIFGKDNLYNDCIRDSTARVAARQFFDSDEDVQYSVDAFVPVGE